MKNVSKIARLASLADTQQRDAAQTLARAIYQQSSHQKKIEELSSYRLDYTAPLSGDASKPLNGADAQQIVAFVANLDNLITTMRSQESELIAAVRRAEQAWIASQRKAKSFDELAQKRGLLEQQTRDARQDRSLDDAWLARHLGRNS